MMDINPIAQKQLLLNELEQYKQAAYILGVRYRVSKQIGASPEELKPIQEALEKNQKFIDAYEVELKSLDDQPMK